MMKNLVWLLIALMVPVFTANAHAGEKKESQSAEVEIKASDLYGKTFIEVDGETLQPKGSRIVIAQDGSWEMTGIQQAKGKKLSYENNHMASLLALEASEGDVILGMLGRIDEKNASELKAVTGKSFSFLLMVMGLSEEGTLFLAE